MWLYRFTYIACSPLAKMLLAVISTTGATIAEIAVTVLRLTSELCPASARVHNPILGTRDGKPRHYPIDHRDVLPIGPSVSQRS